MSPETSGEAVLSSHLLPARFVVAIWRANLAVNFS